MQSKARLSTCKNRLESKHTYIKAKSPSPARGRKIILSSFTPDICMLLAIKQQSYPVMFITNDGKLPANDLKQELAVCKLQSNFSNDGIWQILFSLPIYYFCAQYLWAKSNNQDLFVNVVYIESDNICPFPVVSSTYDHRVWRTGLPVRSAVLKPHAGRLVVWWVTTCESLLLYVFVFTRLFVSLFYFYFYRVRRRYMVKASSGFAEIDSDSQGIVA
ncbi:hypothetical protein N7481_011136 [Penicillium waksmanii]|uniref:uncharacterized protein n=1 Tax=Penicillium waksmanii TaxID=69791 RepID=UPI0025494FE5|nr:uncharacterized protein N7481_011136 [Penicillium waksmanii]KAJ5973926.1 hypothetical protein N7481_011136 [Penicillium waksmanii]